MDPVTYPWQSPYSAFNNNPIVFNDPRGLQGNPANDQSNTKPDPNGITQDMLNDPIDVFGKAIQPKDNIQKPPCIYCRDNFEYADRLRYDKNHHNWNGVMLVHEDGTNDAAAIKSNYSHTEDAAALLAFASAHSFGPRKIDMAWYYYIIGFFVKTTEAGLEITKQTQEVITKIQTQNDIENAVKQNQEQIMEKPNVSKYLIPHGDSITMKIKPDGQDVWYDIRIAPDGGDRIISETEILKE